MGVQTSTSLAFAARASRVRTDPTINTQYVPAHSSATAAGAMMLEQVSERARSRARSRA